MSRSAEQVLAVMLGQEMPSGWAWTRDPASAQGRALLAVATEIAAIEASAEAQLVEADPRAAVALLSDYERVLGPDICAPDAASAPREARQRSVHARWTARGGQSPAFYVGLAAALGYRIAIEEFAVARAGTLRAGDPLNGPAWAHAWRARVGYPELEPLVGLDFTAGAVPAGLTVTRAHGTGAKALRRRPADGVWEEVGAGVPRLHATADGLSGWLLEPAATNLITNPRLEGPDGAAPDGMSVFGGSGVTATVVGQGVVDGLRYKDVRIAGTASAQTAAGLQFTVIGSAIPVVSGDLLTAGFFATVVDGSLNGVLSQTVQVYAYSSSNVVTETPGRAVSIADGRLGDQRYLAPVTFSNAGTAKAFHQCRLTVAVGATVDVTLRIAAPTAERRGFATTPVLPPAGTQGQATRGAETCVREVAPRGTAAGVLYAEVAVDAMPSTGTAIGATLLLTDGSASNIVGLRNFRDAGGAQWDTRAVTGGVVVADTGGATTLTLGAIERRAAGWQTDRVTHVRNGVLVDQDTSAAAPVVTTLSVASGEAVVLIRHLRVYDPLTDERVAQLTTLGQFPEVALGNAPVLFSAGRSAAGDPLAAWGNVPLECVLTRAKPAHTTVLFAYGRDV